MDQEETQPSLDDTEPEWEMPLPPDVERGESGESAEVAPQSARWSFAKRFLFRFALVYFLLYSHPFPLGVIPNPSNVVAAFSSEAPGTFVTDPIFKGIGWYTGAVQDAERWAVDGTASVVFGFDETLDRPFGSGDPTYAYVQLALYMTLALLIAGLWSYLARRRGDHARLAPWLHLAVRYNLAFTMLGYGFAKVFPSQFSWPRLSRLVSDYGDSSPMNVLWSFMGSSPAYTVFAGAGEVLAGALLCFRKTSTLGALVAVAVMTNVVAMNFCYDVPVKLYSSHLLLFALLLTLPDARRLLNTLLFNRTAEPRDLSAPRFPWMSGHVIKLLIVGTTVTLSVKRVIESYTADHDPGAHFGIWDVQRFAEKGDDGSFVDTASADWLALLIERERGGRGGGSLQVPDHTLRGATPEWNEERTSLTLSSASRWSYVEEGDVLILQGEFQHTFRATPFDFKDPGTPRAPQVEIELRRASGGDAPVVDPEIPVGPGPMTETEEVSDEEPETPLPASLVGRWTVVRNELIGDTFTHRRSDPTGWTAVTLTAEGTATFEYEDGPTETYELKVEPEGGILRFSWSSEFAVEQPSADAIVLRGEHRGRTLEIELARRDLNSFLLVRRGFHWINEIPLNRY